MPLSFSGPDDFYTANQKDWWEAVDKALKGASRSRLVGKTDDGFEITPLYDRRTDMPARSLRDGGGDWSIVQRIDLPDVAAANEQILEDLTGGASGVDIIFSDGQASAGVSANSADDIDRLFKGVEINLINVRLDAGSRTFEILDQVMDFARRKGLDPTDVSITVSHDPYGALVRNADTVPGVVDAIKRSIDAVDQCEIVGSPARILNADGQTWHNMGSSQAQELGYVLSAAVAHLRKLEDTTTAPEKWTDRISVTLVADADQFGTIAKARAIRKLWASVLEGAGLPQSPMQLHMVTSRRMLTRRDPWVNLLRNSVASFAAGVGGADSVCVLPHTQAVGLPDAFARRLARNTQSILLEESNLGKVIDPSAGSGAIEDRTDKLCEAAWKVFQGIEAKGGLVQALRDRTVQTQIVDTRVRLEKDIARRKQPITGVSEFPNLDEAPVDVLEAALDGEQAWRLSEPFEVLRDAADAYKVEHAELPTVFLASLGSLAQFTARGSWISNAFASGGLKAVGLGAYASLDELVAAFKESGARHVCLVSSDAVYETEAEGAAKALKSAGADHLYMAGKPGDQEQVYREAGVDTFVFAGCDILAMLTKAHSDLEVRS
ncbi:MAG: methylmalonyl-CoA mutase family protein [Roseibium sp.]